MNTTQNTVLALISESLFRQNINIPDNIDWQDVFDEIKKQEIVSLSYPAIKNRNISDNIFNEWKILRNQYLLNSANNINYHFAIHRLMEKSDIPYVILKGVASGSYYHDYLLRGYGDVDFMVKPADFDRASDLLESDGYKFTEESNKHKVYVKNKMIYELHNYVFRNADERRKHGNTVTLPYD